MHFTGVLVASASLLAVAYANDPLAFTSWPKDLQAGKPVTLTWAGGATDQPVTLTLRKGSSTNLQDVEIITSDAKDGKFTWTPGDNVHSGEDYAFQISQGGERNYSALLKAGPAMKADAVSQSTQSTTGTMTSTNSAATTSGTSMTGTTTSGGTSATQATATTIKPLISSSAAATPSSSPASLTTVTSSVTAAEPFETSNIQNGPDASTTGVVHSSGASSLQSYSKLVLGALGLLMYLVQ